jgi:hypothetical protein
MLPLPRRARPCVRWFGRAFLLAVITACSGGETPPRDLSSAIRDSLRVRREHAFETRPDTFGMRVDSMRILKGTEPDSVAVPWVVVISEFQCAECRRFALEVLPEIRRDIGARGVARLAFVNAPRLEHFNSRFASHAALCAAADGRFWAMHDSLFASLPRWDRIPDPQPFMDSLAIAAGVSPATQQRCTAQQRLLRAIEGDLRRSEKAGATTLPTVFVGERRMPVSALGVDSIRAAIAGATRAR